MGWKSTRHIKREEAEKAYLLVKLLEKKEKWLAKAKLLTDEELGNALDILGDELYDFPDTYGYYGYNFLVNEEPNRDY